MTCGVLGALWLLAMVVIGGGAYGGYDHLSQYISELGATGAPHGREVSWFGFLPVGLLTTAFAFFAWRAAPRSTLSTLGFAGVALFAVGYVGAAVFPCDFECRPETPSFSQLMHELLGLLGYLLSPVTMLLLALASRRWPGANWLSGLGFASSLGALLGFGGLLNDASPFAGGFQRLLETSVMGWVAACGVHLSLQKETAAP
jgi:hypothetical membrane protein